MFIVGYWALSLAYGSVISYEVPRAVEHGKQTAELTLKPNETGTVDAAIVCGALRWRHSGPMVAGSPIVVPLSGIPKGDHGCEVALDVALPDGREGALKFAFQLASLPLVSWAATRAQVDLEARVATPVPSRPLTDAKLVVIGERGAVLQTVPADLSDPTRPRFAWTATGEVLRLEVEGRDAHGFITTLELTPWQYAIPHVDVVFASGKNAIDEAEVPKLEACWAEVERVLAKYGDVVEIGLYVAGYTDTVGSRSANQALSERRARAIGVWFRERGFSRNVYYQGFGEDGQFVQTHDETDEPANRRALYLMASGPPSDPVNLPRADWRAL